MAQQDDDTIDLSIVVPVYRGASTIGELARRLTSTLADRKIRHELIFVEDCGGDASWDVIRAMASETPSVRGFRMQRNYGQHSAILCGIRAARGAAIATLDDDLQHAPEDLPAVFDALKPGIDAVYGAPLRKQHGCLRNLASAITRLVLQKSTGVEAARHASAFRVFRTRLREAFANYNGPAVNIDVLLSWGATRYAVVRVAHQPRQQGRSGYTAFMLAGHAINMMTGFTTLPLKLASLTGFLFALFGMGVLAFVVSRYLWSGSSIPGFPFLASIIAIFSGAQLLALGIIGEYLAQMYQRMMGKPAYVLRESTGGGE
jgi:glycosyltransferase involved in cell wall biosynthesis